MTMNENFFRVDTLVRGRRSVRTYDDRTLSQNDLDKLCATGVHTLKIEGRLKRPEYVTVITRAYRNALDLSETGLHERI